MVLYHSVIFLCAVVFASGALCCHHQSPQLVHFVGSARQVEKPAIHVIVDFTIFVLMIALRAYRFLHHRFFCHYLFFNESLMPLWASSFCHRYYK